MATGCASSSHVRLSKFSWAVRAPRKLETHAAISATRVYRCGTLISRLSVQWWRVLFEKLAVGYRGFKRKGVCLHIITFRVTTRLQSKSNRCIWHTTLIIWLLTMLLTAARSSWTSDKYGVYTSARGSPLTGFFCSIKIFIVNFLCDF